MTTCDDDLDDYEEAQRMAEGEDRLCSAHGTPLAVDGLCEDCVDETLREDYDDALAEDPYEYDEYDDNPDDGGEA